MKRSTRGVKRLGKAVRGAAGMIAKFGLAAGAAALGGLALIVKAGLKSIDTLAKLSRNLQIDIDDLQAFRLAAEIAGVGAEKMDKALKKLTKATADAQNGLAAQKDAFETLGISMDDIAGKDIGEVFRQIADGVQATGLSVTTTGAIMDLFGAKIGTDLVELLRNGREGIDKFKQEIEDMGLALSDVDAAKVEAANDAWTRFKGILSAVGQKITVEFAPFIEAAVSALTEMGKKGDGAGNLIGDAMEFAAKAIGFTANIVQRFALGFQVLADVVIDVFQIMIAQFVRLAKAADWVLDKLGILEGGWSDSFVKMSDAVQQLEDDLKEKIAKNLDSIANGGWGKSIVDKFKAIREEAQKAAEEAVKLGDEYDPKLPEAIEPAVRKVEELAEKVEAVAEPAVAAITATTGGGGERSRQFGEGNLALRVGLGGAAGGEPTDAGQKRIADLLERILTVNLNPPPMPLVWDGN